MRFLKANENIDMFAIKRKTFTEEEEGENEEWYNLNFQTTKLQRFVYEVSVILMIDQNLPGWCWWTSYTKAVGD